MSTPLDLIRFASARGLRVRVTHTYGEHGWVSKLMEGNGRAFVRVDWDDGGHSVVPETHLDDLVVSVQE